MPAYNTSEFKKGLKVQIDGDPYIMIECNFVKPGKGQALYKCKLRNLLRNTVLDRTYKSGDSLDAADISTIEAQYLYKQGEAFVFMDNANYEQYELSKEQVDDAWKWIKEGTVCSMLLYNGNPISMEPPQHMALLVEYAEPAVRGNTATNLTKPVKLETGAEILVPAFSAQQDLRTPARFGVYTVAVNLALSAMLALWLAPPGWAHAGLALAASLAAITNAALLLATLYRRKVYRPQAGFARFILTTLAANLGMAILLTGLMEGLNWQGLAASGRVTQLGACILAAMLVYSLILLLLGLRPRHMLLTGTS